MTASEGKLTDLGPRVLRCRNCNRRGAPAEIAERHEGPWVGTSCEGDPRTAYEALARDCAGFRASIAEFSAMLHAAVEAERAACLGHIREAITKALGQLSVLVRLTQPEGAVKVGWSRTGRELIEREPVMDAVVIIRNAMDGCAKAIRARGGRG